MKISEINDEIGSIVLDTGEVVEIEDDRPCIRKKKIMEPSDRKGMVMIFCDEMIRLSKEKLSTASIRVFFWLIGNLDPDNYIRQTQEEIGLALGMKTQHVSRAMKPLQEKKVIEKSRHGKWFMNPDVALYYDDSKV